MSQRHTIQRTGLAIAVLLLGVAGFQQLSYAVGDALCGCSPTTPCPCAADGVCRPKRTTWGHYNTRWRTWPGEQAGRTPTPADQTADEAEEIDPLGPFETPKPEQEDLRTAPKARKKKVDDDAPAELPGEEPAQLLPGPDAQPEGDALPDLDPFGQLPTVPEMEDAPPALPASLRQAAASMNMPRVATRTSVPTTKQRMNITPGMLAQPVQQVSWQPTGNMPLINPASAVRTTTEHQPLQQAVYFEASDQ